LRIQALVSPYEVTHIEPEVNKLTHRLLVLDDEVRVAPPQVIAVQLKIIFLITKA